MTHKILLTLSGIAACATLAACNPQPQQAQQPQGRTSHVMAIDTPPPQYPLQQACDGIGGIVELVINVGADGTVQGSSVSRSSNVPELDAAAQEAVKKWKFEPQYVNGKAIPTKIASPMSFKPPEEPNPLCKK